MNINLIVARTKNKAIGKNDRLLWKRLKGDMNFFKNKTTNNAVLIGRKTFDGMGTFYLKNRDVFVLSNTLKRDNLPSNYYIVSSINEAIEKAKCNNHTEFYIAGGTSIYNNYINMCNRLYITDVDVEIEGDSYFDHDTMICENYTLKMKTYHFKDNDNEFDFTVNEYIKKENI